MQFKVPQFLDIEDKIFGPFTFRQFVYLAGGAGICFILYRLLGLVIGAIPILIVAGFSAALTFYRPNNKPFINMVEASLKYVAQSKLYIWKKSVRTEAEKGDLDKTKDKIPKVTMAAAGGPRLDSNKLRDLAWSLDVLDLSKKETDS